MIPRLSTPLTLGLVVAGLIAFGLACRSLYRWMDDSLDPACFDDCCPGPNCPCEECAYDRDRRAAAAEAKGGQI